MTVELTMNEIDSLRQLIHYTLRENEDDWVLGTLADFRSFLDKTPIILSSRIVRRVKGRDE